MSESHAKTLAAVNSSAPPTPKEVNNFQTYLIAVTICMGAAAYGAFSFSTTCVGCTHHTIL